MLEFIQKWIHNNFLEKYGFSEIWEKHAFKRSIVKADKNIIDKELLCQN
jgi:hypothetical protein